LGEFDGKAVIVTGGALGIGRGIAQGFAAEGAKVAIADINEMAAEKLAAELERAIAVIGDVSRAADAKRMVDAAVASAGWTCWSTTPASCRSTATFGSRTPPKRYGTGSSA
jgi:NAD(P)-dependent dehydrogenase (short-subunit alcohol dehydrogenase family)